MSPRTLLFDFDGTLADTLPLCVTALRASLLRHTGRVHSDAEITAHFGVTEEGIFRRMAPAAWERCLACYLEEYERSHHLCAAPFPGVQDLLADLRRRGIRVGLVTGKGPVSLAISLRRLELGELFDQVRSGSPDRDLKVEQIGELVRAFGVDPSRAAYVGDAVNDVRAARAAGVRALGAAWAPAASAARLAAERPDAILRSVEELERWVEAWSIGPGE